MFHFERLFQIGTEQRKFRATEHGGFDVLDFSVLDTALKELEKQVRHRFSSRREELIVIEFARDDYSKALQQFSPAFLKDAYFLFIDADMNTCIERVQNRVAHPTSEDDHFVSEAILRNYYNRQRIPSNLKINGGESIDKLRVKLIDSSGIYQDFIKKVNQFVSVIFQQEGYQVTSYNSRLNLTKVNTNEVSRRKVHLFSARTFMRRMGVGAG